jgi:hypothetical protein
MVALCQVAAFVFHQWVENPLIAFAARFLPRNGSERTTSLAITPLASSGPYSAASGLTKPHPSP